MKYFILVVLLFLGIVAQVYLVSIPVVVGEVILATVLFPRWWIFLLGVVIGVVLDSLAFQSLGSSSIFFSIVSGLLFLYSRKYEMQNPFFVGMSIFIASLLYGAIFIHRYAFWGALVCSGALTALYIGILFFILPRKKAVMEF